MIVAAKCNITSYALKKLNELYWGTKYKNIDDAILENYAESLDCIDKLVICYPSDCKNDTIIFTCNLSIAKISNSIFENTVTFFVADDDLTGAIGPLQYHWTFEADDFDNSGEIDIDQSVLTVKEGKDLNLLVSLISVVIIDVNGCTDTKNCYLTPQRIMQCADDYIACLNTSELKVINKVINCVNTSGLIVSKKL